VPPLRFVLTAAASENAKQQSSGDLEQTSVTLKTSLSMEMQVKRLRIKARKVILAWMAPRKYGDP
jgi:hypothetical protein